MNASLSVRERIGDNVQAYLDGIKVGTTRLIKSHMRKIDKPVGFVRLFFNDTYVKVVFGPGNSLSDPEPYQICAGYDPLTKEEYQAGFDIKLDDLK